MADFSKLEVSSLFNTKGWVAVVTGGGTGLGLITAQTLAANGVKVYITGRRVDKLKAAETQHQSGGSITGVQMDVTSKDSIREAVKTIESKEKYINFLVNNAGVSGISYGDSGMPTGDIRSISQKMMDNESFDDWAWFYKVMVASYYFTAVALLPLLVATREHGFPDSGSILNISSMSGITKDSQNGQFAYNSTKAATISLTEMMAHDFKREDLLIRVNTLAPGYFPSEMTPIEATESQKPEFFRKQWGIPFGRGGEPKDYAQAVLNFAVNQYVTGATLTIDGAWLLAHA